MPRIPQIAAVLGFGLVSCTGASPTPSEGAGTAPSTSATESSQAQCAGDELDGAYGREFTAETTDSSDLLGAWTLEIDSCTYRISVDGIEQGAGRMQLVDGAAASGQIELNDEILCGNEFTGAAFYDITLDGGNLAFVESIQGTDQCEGRAEAFTDDPAWERR